MYVYEGRKTKAHTHTPAVTPRVVLKNMQVVKKTPKCVALVPAAPNTHIRREKQTAYSLRRYGCQERTHPSARTHETLTAVAVNSSHPSRLTTATTTSGSDDDHVAAAQQVDVGLDARQLRL